MKFYIELTLLPSAEIPLHFLWEKVYPQVHLAFVEMQGSDGKMGLGVSFPCYDLSKRQLGNTLRIFAVDRLELEKLDMGKWISRLTDYVHLTTIREVPERIDGYGCFKRVQTKSNTARMARRKAKRENISLEKAMAALAGRKEKVSKVPFIHMKSLGSGKRYPLLIGYGKMDDACNGVFSTYGLSSLSTVPMW